MTAKPGAGPAGAPVLIARSPRALRRLLFIESYIAPDMHMRPAGETVRLIENAGFEVTGSALAFEEGRMGVDQILAIRKAR